MDNNLFHPKIKLKSEIKTKLAKKNIFNLEQIYILICSNKFIRTNER